MLHYTLSVEKNGLVVCLLRAVTDAMQGGVELAEEWEALPENPNPAFQTLTRDEFLRTLLRTPSALSENESEIVYASSGHMRYVAFNF